MTKIGNYELRGRMLVVDGGSIYLQKNFGASVWIPVATVVDTMDPSFLKISPDGQTLALGTGYMQPLYLFGAGILDTQTPTALSVHAEVKRVDADYYDAAWRDNRWLFINSSGPAGSQVYAIDTLLPNPASAFVPVIETIPGASAGITFDRFGNLVTGIGFGVATGELKIWPSASIETTLAPDGDGLDYLGSGHLLATSILSAASLGVDANNNLHVGGGNFFGGGDMGFAVLVQSDVLERAAAGGAPVDPANPAEYREIAPDPCRNDDATTVQYIASLDMLVVSANLASVPPNCASFDNSGNSGTATVQLYFPPGAPDTDGDGIPDGADNAYLTPNPDQSDDDGDGFGDVADADFNNDGVVDLADYEIFLATFDAVSGAPSYDVRADFNADGVVDFVDYETFATRWGTSAPFY